MGLGWITTVLASPFLYAYIWAGVIVAGDIVLVPALYFARTGEISLSLVIVAALFASFVADSVWYAIGRFVPRERARELPLIRARQERFDKLHPIFNRYGVWFAGIAKLMFGMRAIVQILCGMHRVSPAKFLTASMLGAGVWIAVLLTMLSLIDAGIAAIGDIAYQAQIAFTSFIVAAFVFQVVAKRVLQRIIKR